jgi:hypothetical protein
MQIRRATRCQFARARFVVESPSLDRDQSERMSSELSRLSQECGCDVGARFLMISIFAWVIGALPLWSTFRARPIFSLTVASLASFLSAGVGKAIGIRRAKRELRATLLSLCSQLENQEAMIHGLHR